MTQKIWSRHALRMLRSRMSCTPRRLHEHIVVLPQEQEDLQHTHRQPGLQRELTMYR